MIKEEKPMDFQNNNIFKDIPKGNILVNHSLFNIHHSLLKTSTMN
jgi:hypothetical protein